MTPVNLPMVQVKHHPSSVDLELVKRLLADTKTPTLKKFLCKEFSCISADYAGALACCDCSCLRLPCMRSWRGV